MREFVKLLAEADAWPNIGRAKGFECTVVNRKNNHTFTFSLPSCKVVEIDVMGVCHNVFYLTEDELEYIMPRLYENNANRLCHLIEDEFDATKKLNQDQQKKIAYIKSLGWYQKEDIQPIFFFDYTVDNNIAYTVKEAFQIECERQILKSLE